MYSAEKSDMRFSIDDSSDITQGSSLTLETTIDPLELSDLSPFTADYLDFPQYDLFSSPSSSSYTVLSEQNQPPVSETIECEDSRMSVSTTFYPGSMEDYGPTDITFLSCDSVFFYLHYHELLSASNNNFNHLMEQSHRGTIIPLPDSSAVLNVVFHAMYGLTYLNYVPPFETLSTAVDALEVYGVNLHRVLSPPSPLFTLFLSHASSSPLELYSLAAQKDLLSLAVSTSAHLLSFSLTDVTDETARRIGPSYLRRLFFLHLGRIDAFKRILLPPPHFHAPNRTCDVIDHNNLGRAWALAAASLAWDSRPDISGDTIEMTLDPLSKHLQCEMCLKAFKDRVKAVIAEWSEVKRTI